MFWQNVSKTLSWRWWVCQKPCPDPLVAPGNFNIFQLTFSGFGIFTVNSGSLRACSHSHKPGGFIPLNKKKRNKTIILWVSCCLSSIILPMHFVCCDLTQPWSNSWFTQPWRHMLHQEKQLFIGWWAASCLGGDLVRYGDMGITNYR